MFSGNYDLVFLHCEVYLCDSTKEECEPVSVSLDWSPVGSPHTFIGLTDGGIDGKKDGQMYKWKEGERGEEEWRENGEEEGSWLDGWMDA